MEMILFVGLPGSGKSTFYKNHYFNTHLRISNDLLRTKNRTQKLLDFCGENRVPKTAILMKAKELERPSLEEGFDELIIIDGDNK